MLERVSGGARELSGRSRFCRAPPSLPGDAYIIATGIANSVSCDTPRKQLLK